MVTVNCLNFNYKKRINILENIELNLERGNVYGLLGKNGEGKTTLLKCMSGFCFTLDSMVSIEGESIEESKSRIFYLPEEIYFPKIKLKKYIPLLKNIYSKFDEVLFRKYLKEFELNENMILTILSSGQNKKIAVSIALSTGCDIILLDEPTNAMDIMSKKIFKRIILEEVHSNKLIVISTHQIADIENIISDLIVLNNRSIAFNKSVNDIIDNLEFSKGMAQTIIPENIIYIVDNTINRETISKRISKEGQMNVDLELLYEAIIKDSNKVNQAFKITRL